MRKRMIFVVLSILFVAVAPALADDPVAVPSTTTLVERNNTDMDLGPTAPTKGPIKPPPPQIDEDVGSVVAAAQLFEPVYCYMGLSQSGITTGDAVAGKSVKVRLFTWGRGWPSDDRVLSSGASVYYNFGDSAEWTFVGNPRQISSLPHFYEFPEVQHTFAATGKYLMAVEVVDAGRVFRCQQEAPRDFDWGETLVNVYNEAVAVPNSIALTAYGDGAPVGASVTYDNQVAIGAVSYSYRFWGTSKWWDGSTWLETHAKWGLYGAHPLDYSWMWSPTNTWDLSSTGALFDWVHLYGEPNTVTFELRWDPGRSHQDVAHITLSNIRVYWWDPVRVFRPSFLRPNNQ